MKDKVNFRNKEEYKRAKEKILNTPDNGYRHNIIALVLLSLSKELGKEAANKLIDDLGLNHEKAT